MNPAEDHNRHYRNWRRAGITFMVLGAIAAGTVYGLGSRSESQDDDPTMTSYLKVETRQMQYMYGKEGVIMEDLKNGIKQPGTQAVMILIFSGIAAAVCFHGARRAKPTNRRHA